MRRRWAALGFAVMLLAGCGTSAGDQTSSTPAAPGSPQDLAEVRQCSEVYADGTTTDPDVFDQMCWAAPGGKDPYVYGTAVEDCTDGRQLAHNDAGWGYVGKPWHTHEPGGELVAPAAEREICEGS